jgi:DNA-binding SARP family transcriptional activator
VLTVRLIGSPSIDDDSAPAAAVRVPRGRKAWALLCYVLLCERPPSRRQVADLLFSDADDPLGAVRWTLAELRRALGRADVLRGDPLQPDLGADVTVDVVSVRADKVAATELLGLTGELLDGVDIPSHDFESWLLVQRHRVSAAIEALLHQAAVTALAAGHAAEAVPFASLAVGRNPLDERNHELLVRSLAASGDRVAALRQVAMCEDLLQRELGVTASPALRDAADAGPVTALAPPVGGGAAVTSQLEAGRAAIGAGAIDAGIQCLRRAVSEAMQLKDAALEGQALVALGGALVHATRGRDEEGAVVLTEAIEAAHRAGDRATSARAHRELGYIDVQAGRRGTGEAWLTKAQEIADTDSELAAILGVRGMSASDRGDYPDAFEHLAASVEHAARAADNRQQAFSLGLVGRAHILRGEPRQAAASVDRALELVHAERWVAFLPWPQALHGEIELAIGALDQARTELEKAWALACQVGDPCWESMSARGLGVIAAREGDLDAATVWFDEAVTRCRRTTDRYQWMHAHALDARITAALDREDEATAAALITTLATLAARCDMREFVVRAQLHRARMGDGDARTSAALLSADIDNPALAALVRAGRPG